MASEPVIHIGENSPEQVAYKLSKEVLSVEDHKKWTRQLILDAYAECLLAVRDPLNTREGKYRKAAPS